MTVEPMTCPQCREALHYVWEQVREVRQYTFSVDNGEYIGFSDPIDDTSVLESVICPYCLESLPRETVEEIRDRFEAFSESP